MCQNSKLFASYELGGYVSLSWIPACALNLLQGHIGYDNLEEYSQSVAPGL